MKNKEDLITRVNIYLPQIFYYSNNLKSDNVIIEHYNPTKLIRPPAVSSEYKNKDFISGKYYKKLINI